MEIKRLIQERKPFAVVMYYEWLKASPSERNTVYEIIQKSHMDHGLTYRKLTGNILDEFLSLKKELELVEHTSDGKVWEFMSFRDRIRKKAAQGGSQGV